jgi:hypothetical protein
MNSTPRQPPSIPRSILLYTSICIISVVVAVAAVLAYDAKQHEIAWGAAAQFTSGQSIFIPDAETGYRVRPDLAAVSDSPALSYYTNGRGARTNGPGVAAPDKVDFITIGDSQTVGYGVASDETYTSDLARETNLVGLNFGVSGFGGVGSLLVLRRELDLAPKFVVYGFWEDHLNRNVRPCLESGTPFCIPRPSVTIGPSGPSIRLPEDPVNALTRAKLWFGDGKPPFVKDFLASAVRNWGFFAAKFDRARAPEGVSDKDKIEAQAYVLQQMKQTADSIDAPLIVVWIPVYFYPEINDLPARLAAVIKDAGILLVDMAPRFREMQREGAVIAIPGNGHMTPAAHQAVAAAVAKLLKEHKMLEEHASSPRSSGCGVDAEAARCDGGDAH